jgi:predicted ArsR family transcriptional regulator
MQSTFAVLAEPNRRRILDELCQGERSVGELVERLSLSQPAVSKHLRVLREAEIDAWLAPYRRFWAERLDALQAHLDEEQE